MFYVNIFKIINKIINWLKFSIWWLKKGARDGKNKIEIEQPLGMEVGLLTYQVCQHNLPGDVGVGVDSLGQVGQ